MQINHLALGATERHVHLKNRARSHMSLMHTVITRLQASTALPQALAQDWVQSKLETTGSWDF